MLGKTHHAGGTVAALVAFEVMRAKGWLLPDCSEFVQLLMMYPFASFGSIVSDLDHGPDSIPSKDPVAIGINKLLRLTGAKHRSWQTHSILVTGGFCLLLFSLVFLGSSFINLTNSLDWICLRLAVIGFICGVVSHLVLDIITTAGIHIWPGKKIRFVPRSSAFATGGTWEKIIFYILIAIIVIIIGKILYIELSPLVQNLLVKLTEMIK
jgi:membrane-bound metal-dependent hydrolase YbcI (DUF457 family)